MIRRGRGGILQNYQIGDVVGATSNPKKKVSPMDVLDGGWYKLVVVQAY